MISLGLNERPKSVSRETLDEFRNIYTKSVNVIRETLTLKIL